MPDPFELDVNRLGRVRSAGLGRADGPLAPFLDWPRLVTCDGYPQLRGARVVVSELSQTFAHRMWGVPEGAPLQLDRDVFLVVGHGGYVVLGWGPPLRGSKPLDVWSHRWEVRATTSDPLVALALAYSLQARRYPPADFSGGLVRACGGGYEGLMTSGEVLGSSRVPFRVVKALSAMDGFRGGSVHEFVRGMLQ